MSFALKRRICPLMLLVVVIVTAGYAQNREKHFVLGLPTAVVSHSLYQTIDFLDSRADTSNLGWVQKGVLNAPARVVAEPTLGQQLTNALAALTDSTAGDGRLLLQLRHMQFAELTGAFAEKGHCYMRVSLYAEQDDRYFSLATLDTVVSVNSMEVTNGLLRHTGNTLVDFIAVNLTRQPNTQTNYSRVEVMAMDSIEKRNIPLYTTDTYAEGLYRTYQSFAAQIPDAQLEVREKAGAETRVMVSDASGKARKVRPKDVYAIVYRGTPYVATSYGYYPLWHEGNDLFFMGKDKVTAATSNVIVASAFFGIVGALVASNADAAFEMKLDHLNGGFIRLREIPNIARKL